MPDSEPENNSCSALPADAIHIWHARISAPPWPVSSLWEVLARPERDRAADYVSPKHRHACVLRRGLLRVLLSYYLGVPAQELQLVLAARGKPELAPRPDKPPLGFSLSQSGDVVLYAVSRQTLGIDVEWVAAPYDIAAIAGMYFTDAERSWLRKLPVGQQRVTALRIWTYKEAYGKATGTGLTNELCTVCMVHDGAAGGLIQSAVGQHSNLQWTSLDVRAVPGYVATVVYPAQMHCPRTLRIRSLCSLAQPNPPGDVKP